MQRPRISPLDPPYEPELAAELARFMPPGIPPLRLFRTLAHNPRVLRKFRLGSLLDRGSIERRDREIVILRTCARCGSEYEWGVHVAVFAGRCALTQEEVAALLRPGTDDGLVSPRDRLLVRLADELHDLASISETLWVELTRQFRADQLIELLVVAGFYHTVSFLTNALQIELEETAPRFAAYSRVQEPSG